MRTFLCILVLLWTALTKEQEGPPLSRSPLADYLLAIAEVGKRITDTIDGLQVFNPQRMFQSFWYGERFEARNRFNYDLSEESFHNDEFLSHQFTEEEKSFIKKTILNHENKQKVHLSSHLSPKSSENAGPGIRQLQETNFDQLPVINKTREEEYLNEQNIIIVQMTARRFRVVQNYSMPLNRSCFGKAPKVNYTIQTFICRGVRLTEAEYANRTNLSGCYVNNATVEACYCSFDFYGRYCDKFMGLTCQGKKVTDYDAECLKDFYSQYGTKRMGYPPCRPFKDGVYNFDAEVSCALYNVSKELNTLDFMRDGIKMEYMMLPGNNIVHKNFTNPNITFNYAMVNSEVDLVHCSIRS